MNEYLLALSGGAIIGLSASIMLLSYGRILGISGILGGFLSSPLTKEVWRFFFLLGLISGGFVTAQFFPENFTLKQTPNILNLIIAGLLVGFGTQIGSGCTSGHGVCGISRASKRSIVATLVFMAAGVVAVLLMKSIGKNL